MIDHPFLDFTGLSDDELLDKMSELHGKLSKAHMWGSGTDIVNQLEWMLEMVEEEKMERVKRQQFEALQNMFPEVVESDPAFTKAKETEDTTAKVIKPAQTRKAANLPPPSFDKQYESKDKK